MTPSSATLYRDLGLDLPEERVVLSQDGTSRTAAAPRRVSSEEVDPLFDGRKAYVVVKNEKPEHRLMLWMRLRGHRPEEIARTLGYTVVHVRTLCKQPWFVEAFCRLSSEMGKDAVQTFLEGEVLPAMQRTVELATGADSDAVRLAANKEIMDRFLGKAVARVEQKVVSTVDVTISDISSLLAERQKNEERLRANGILLGAN